MSVLSDMLGMIPEFVRDDPMMQAYYEAVAPELETLFAEGLAAPGQAWVLTVSSEIDRLERIFGIIPNPLESLETRRSKLTAKLRGGLVSTLASLRETAESYAGVGIDITEDPSTYTLEISILNYLGVPAYLEALKASILAATPAHLAVLFTLRWLIWNELITRADTWDTIYAAGITWAALKEYGEVI